MSTKQLATFHVGDLFLGVDVRRVQEVLRVADLTPVPLAPTAIAGLMNLRGQVITAVDLRKRSGRPVSADDDTMHVVVLADGEAVSLVVDSIGDVIWVTDDRYQQVPDSLGGPERELITGTYMLDESLLLVLDIERAIAAV